MERDTTELHSFLLSNSQLGNEKVSEIVKLFQQLSVPKNTIYLNEGQVSNAYAFLTKGYMRAFTYDTEGNEVTTAFYQNNQLVFEVNSFFTRTPSKECIQAITDCTVFYIDFNQLNQLFHSIPEFREFGRSVLVKCFVDLKQRTLAMINETAEQRYISLLANNPNIFQFASLKHIASFLGITDTSLSRIRKDLANKC
ncbi:MAG: Crp/Fnr family transcriptional regulator [Bacteroidota bacterium]